MLANLSGSYDGVMALHRLMQSEEPTLSVEDTVPLEAGGETELKSMMRDPRYWKQKDPAFVKKVTEGFKSVYGE